MLGSSRIFYGPELEDERGGQFVWLHRRRVAMLIPISFEIALIAVDFVEMIEKTIEFGLRPVVVRDIRPWFKPASRVAVEREIFDGLIGHCHGACSADHAIARPQR